jgi:hypothetical protein
MNPDGGFRGNLLRGFARVVVAIGGVCSIAWALLAYPALRDEAVFAAAADHILSGEQYGAEQLSKLRSELGASSANSFRPSVLNDIAVVRLRLVEADLASGQAPVADLDGLQQSVDAALSHNPTLSFLWLTDYWLQNRHSGGADAASGLLRMSYLTAPNEGWIATKRNPVALGVFGALPEELKGRVVAEFARLVQSGLYEDAVKILSGPGWPVHERLLEGLARLDEGDRRRFAKLLEEEDLEGVVVPGIDRPPARPF